MYNECFYPCPVRLNKTLLVFMLEIGKGMPCQHTDKLQNSFCSQEKSLAPQKSQHPKEPQREKWHMFTDVKISSSTFQMVTLISVFREGSSRIRIVVNVLPSHLLLQRKIFYLILTFCMEITNVITPTPSPHPLPNQTHWVTYFLNLSCFLSSVSS